MRFFYNLVACIAQPFVAIYWLFRGIINPSYRDRIGQRFGLGYPKLHKSIWLHAVSVGEVQAALPLITALLNTG